MGNEKTEGESEKKEMLEMLVYTTCSKCGQRYLAHDVHTCPEPKPKHV